MRQGLRALLAAGACALSLPAAAQDRPLCPDRPGLGTPACTVAPGHVMLETAFADWTRDTHDGEREDIVLVADSLVRIGVADALELQLGWTPFGHDRQRRVTGAFQTDDRVGDALLGAKLNLAHPDGKGFAVALQPTVTLPVGRTPIGADDWSAALEVPVTFDLNDAISLQATPSFEYAANDDRGGHHAAVGTVLGVGVQLSDAVNATVEMQLIRDDDPGAATTQALAGAAIAWQPGKHWQLDLGAALGLNHDTPDTRLYAGIAHLF